MSTIYGWLNTRPDPACWRAFIGQQAAAWQGPVRTDPVCYQHPQAELAGHGLEQAPWLHQDGDWVAMIGGRPAWRDSQLAALADRHNPAHALLAGFLAEGRAVLAKLGGEFSCCLMAPGRCYALLAVDRVGLATMAYRVDDGLLVFGERPGQVIAHPGLSAVLNPQAIFHYVYFQAIPSPHSIYQGVVKLQPAEWVEVDGGRVRQGFYWQPDYQPSRLPKARLLAQLPEQLRQAVGQCPNDPATGAFLSGGLDSSTVVGMFSQCARRPVDAFTIGFAADGYDEMDYARLTARHFQARLHEYYLTPADVLAAIPLLARAYDEPFGNASAIPAYYCAKLARERGMARLLAGDGGDELFAGNARYAKQKLFDYYQRLPAFARPLLDAIAVDLPLLRKLNSYVRQAKTPMPQRLETYNHLHRTPLAEIFNGDFLAQVNPDLPVRDLCQVYRRGPADDLLKNMMFLDHKFTLADNDLRKVTTMCRLAGISVHYPLLQDGLIEFAATIPSPWLLQGLRLRSFYKQALRGFLADQTLAKPKHGFGLPFGVWMREDKALDEFARASLEALARRGIVNSAYLQALTARHQHGHAAYFGVMVWLLVVLEQWLQAHGH